MTLRAYLRQRERLLDYAASHIQHMQKALDQMNVQLHHVVSDITGVTGMRIVRDILASTRDPALLAAHRDRRCKASAETIAEALTGNYREEHVFALRQAVELYDCYQEQVAKCDQEIERVLGALQQDAQAPEVPLPKPRHRGGRQPRGDSRRRMGSAQRIIGAAGGLPRSVHRDPR